MGVLDVVRGRNDTRTVGTIAGSTDSTFQFKDEKDGLSGNDFEINSGTVSSEAYSNNTEINRQSYGETDGTTTRRAQPGVQKAEATALAWSKKAAYGAYAMIWLAFFMLALQSSISSSIIQNAYSTFSAAPQVSTANILSNIVAGVMKLPVARTLNLWGRCEGFLVSLAVYLIGIIILASCNGPNSYAAGYTLYWVGYDALYLILDVFVADTSGLRNRAFAFAFASTPFICTAFTGPLAAQSFLKTASWRWAYGAFAIIIPVVFLPVALIFKLYQRKAERMGIYPRRPSGRTVVESVIHYIHEFDLVGAFLLMAAFILILLPFSLTSYGRTEYKSATFIAMVIIGFCLFFVFAAWERFGARTHFIRYELFKERTVVGACCLATIMFLSFYCWDLYLFSFCIVVFRLSVGMAGYIGQIYNVGSCFWSVLFGIAVRVTRQFKYLCLGFGLPLLILGVGLMIHFRGQGYIIDEKNSSPSSHSGIGYIVMCQIFIAFAGGTLVIGQDMAVMAAADREGVPMMLSMLSLFSSLGSAIGYAVSAAIYSNTFVDALTDALPADAKAEAFAIYAGGYVKQELYPLGSEIRTAIDYAWSIYMRDACIAATAILALGFPAIGVWKNYRLDRKQNKGVVI
ncbi:hypothetical protein DTO271G3_6213 [Paecilomyces variotii]|nr:hypothetical protein DTO271G3_6213 [Paecilomyces variotii]